MCPSRVSPHPHRISGCSWNQTLLFTAILFVLQFNVSRFPSAKHVGKQGWQINPMERIIRENSVGIRETSAPFGGLGLFFLDAEPTLPGFLGGNGSILPG